jgi:tol-pal system protein YbgF
MLRRSGRACGVLSLSLALAGPVLAATNPQDFDQRLRALEQAAGAGTGQSQAQLVIQLQQMQAELRQLRGMVEESTNQVQQLQKRQREFYLDLDGRLSALEPGGVPAGASRPPAAEEGASDVPPPADAMGGDAQAPSPPALPAPPATDPGPVERPVAAVQNAEPEAPTGVPPPPAGQVASIAPAPTAANAASEQAAYRAASDLLRIGRYEDAIAGFQAQLQQYPGGSLAANAQYWIGEAYYVTRQFDRALSEFQRVPAEYPQSPKAADALLKVGYIQYERRQFAAARQTLTGLKTTWPNSPAARLAENRLSRMQEEGV